MSNSDPTQLKLVKKVDRPGVCFGMARVPGGERLFYGASDARVYDIDLAAEKPDAHELAGHAGYVLGVAQAGAFVISGAYDGRLIWWNVATREVVRTVDAHAKWIRGVVAAPGGKLVASVADDMLCKLWDVETGQLVRTLAGHDRLTPQHYPSMLFACAFSADGQLIATADKVGRVIIWEVDSGNRLAAVEAPLLYTWDAKQRRHSIGGARSVAFSPDAKLVAVGGTGQINNVDHLEALARLELFDWRGGQRTHEFPGEKFKGLVECMAWHPAGDWLVTAGGDHEGFIKFFDITGNKLLHQEKAPMHVHSLALNEAADTLYLAGHGKIAVYEFKPAPPPAQEAKPPA